MNIYPQLAVFGLGGMELLVILLALLIVPASMVALIIFLINYAKRPAAPPPVMPQPPEPSPQPPVTATVRVCPQCGSAVPLQSPQGLCPACLMKVGMGSQFTAGHTPPSGPVGTPPTPAEIAGFFPQLEILEFLGRGGMGMVYRARQPQLEREVALKILLPELSRDPAFAERFTREAKALARLNHPNIVAVYDSGQAGPHYFLLMEYMDGLNLWQIQQTRRIAPAEALAIVPKICDALQFAHDEGIVHRDIKPANILMDKKGRVKIADFGLAKLLGQEKSEPHLTQGRAVMGTPHYMAPEQVENPLAVDHRADIYSLGVVIYEMLTGELPLGRFAPPSQKVQIDVRLDEVVLRTLEKEPSRRYQQASAFKADMETACNPPEDKKSSRWQQPSYEYRSPGSIGGLPWVHVAYGTDPHTGKARVARGVVAIGAKARGIFACGGQAVGVFAFGGICMGGITFGGINLGIVSIGGIAFALLAQGGMAFGLLGAMGGLAIAPVASGGLAIGYYAQGGMGLGKFVLDNAHQHPEALRFFSQLKIQVWSLLMSVLLFGGIAVSFLLPVCFSMRSFVRRQHRLAQVGFAVIMIVVSFALLKPVFNAWQSVWRNRLKAASAPARLTLNLSGVITDRATGRPIAGAMITDTFYRLGTTQPEYSANRYADTNGFYRLTTHTGTNHSLTISAPHYLSAVLPFPLPMEMRGADGTLNLALPPIEGTSPEISAERP